MILKFSNPFDLTLELDELFQAVQDNEAIRAHH